MVGGVVSTSSPAEGASFGLTPDQVAYAAWVRRAAADLAMVEPVHGAVNRRLVKTMGEAGLLRGLFGGAPDEPPREGAARPRGLLPEMVATINPEAETALALQVLGSYPILQSGNGRTRDRWVP